MEQQHWEIMQWNAMCENKVKNVHIKFFVQIRARDVFQFAQVTYVSQRTPVLFCWFFDKTETQTQHLSGLLLQVKAACVTMTWMFSCHCCILKAWADGKSVPPSLEQSDVWNEWKRLHFDQNDWLDVRQFGLVQLFFSSTHTLVMINNHLSITCLLGCMSITLKVLYPEVTVSADLISHIKSSTLVLVGLI